MSTLLKLVFVLVLCLLSFNAYAAESIDSISQLVGVAERPSLTFELNQGQAASQFDYLVRSRRQAVLINSDSASLVLATDDKALPKVVRIRLLGARRTVKARSLEPLVTRTNYLIGNDSARWKTGIPNYGRVAYEQVYPGIDLVYYGRGSELEFDFAIAPGADPRKVELVVDGAEISEREGGLTLAAGDTRITLHRPEVYQFFAGKKTNIKAHYVLENNRIRFAIADYDHSKRLVIDPVLAYSTLLGAWSLDQGTSIAVDAAGYTYLAGNTVSNHFPTTAGAYDSVCGVSGCNGNFDVFVAKLTPRGTRVWVTYIGGESSEYLARIAVDSSGHAYITGQTGSWEYPATALSGLATFWHPFAFITKLNQNGSGLLYSVRFCSSCEGHDLAVNAAGEAFVAGGTLAPRLLTTSGALQSTAPPCATLGTAPCYDGFVAKLNSAGTALVYSTYLGGTGFDVVWGIALDTSGNAYVTGGTNSGDFPTTPGSFLQSGPSTSAVFVTKLNGSGSALAYSTLFYGLGMYRPDFRVTGIAVDPAGEAYITGMAPSLLPITPLAYQPTPKGISDAFVTKFNATGSDLIYSTYIGGSDGDPSTSAGDLAARIAVNGAGEAYITGMTQSTDFPTTINAFQRVKRTTSFELTCFVTKLNSSGSALSYSSYLGGSDSRYSVCTDIALGPFQNAYVSGWTDTSDFPTTPDAFMKSNTPGDVDAFAVQISPLCPLDPGNLSVTICQPGDGATVTSPVTIKAGTRDTLPVKLMEIFIDGKKVDEANLSAIMVRWPLNIGTHRITVRAHDFVNQPFSASINVDVGP